MFAGVFALLKIGAEQGQFQFGLFAFFARPIEHPVRIKGIVDAAVGAKVDVKADILAHHRNTVAVFRTLIRGQTVFFLDMF